MDNGASESSDQDQDEIEDTDEDEGGAEDTDEDTDEDSAEDYVEGIASDSDEAPPTRTWTRGVEKNLLKNLNPTFVTPRVKAIATRLSFANASRVADLPEDFGQTSLSAKKRAVHISDPATMTWVEASKTTTPVRDYYTGVKIDGVTYMVDDIVIVEPGQDQDRKRAKNAQSQLARCTDNMLANTKWFCKILYMFERVDKLGRRSKHFHAQWLQHGSQTLLQEAAHPRGLFWLNECDDLPLECIFSKCNLHSWAPGEPAPVELQSQSYQANCFFAGLTWDSENCAFLETPILSPAVPHGSCAFCDLRKAKVTWTLDSAGVLSHDSVNFHVNDFVYLHTPGHVTGLLTIAQIMGFISDGNECIEVKVQHFGRVDTLTECLEEDPCAPRDNRRLFLTMVVTTVAARQISGKAYVTCPSSPLQAEAFVKLDDHFYCDLQSVSLAPQSIDDMKRLDPSGISQCDICSSTAMNIAMEKERLLKLYGPLKGLELFAGAGGLSTGLKMSGAVNTRWAVEFSPGAARTYKANHPETTVYNQCSNLLLEHAVQTADLRVPKPLRSLDPLSCVDVPLMPQPGEVDFIYGGPPCQSFSMMNHWKKANDPRSTLVCNMISYVEFYRPKFFLLENVVGMLSYKVGGHQDGKRIAGGVQMGVIKFILSSLTTLGYQAHFKVLQAGQHGAPQGRRRVIVLGARRDVPLPAFPLPQYAFPTAVHNVNLPTGEVLLPVTRPGSDEGGNQCAPIPCVTVMEAINDLVCAHKVQMAYHSISFCLAHDVGDRLADGIVRFSGYSFPGTKRPSGYVTPAPYPHPPLSRYQSWLRAGNGDSVLYHYAKRHTVEVVERVTNIPIEPDAGHEDLPEELELSSRKGKPQYRTMYGRINGNGQFLTAMTTVAPNAKGGKVVHPTQKRILTVRECARAQGFPDSYQFLSVNKKWSNDCLSDQLRQIGNAVPIPLAHALGKSIGNVLYELMKIREEQEQE
ncbi:S-adenosyl-L-methionine-dependent methyltransferase [Trametes gibbosa]|nr:S-adenosyl-L-methionine-dependent methyltransferase [Trametes gibbosa]